MSYQSLYRRYRPRRFSEVRGQDHVVTALRNAVRSGTEGHAYLFSGPRGTGKTSTARILAKALNCEHLVDGEPDCECESCQDIEAGRSFDLFELDAASNNGVDSVRDLIERSVVASPGRTKVYILDEVHMLSTAASNALLKTLEEPPDHVRFVLATTDPQKVLPTIRSRTQHFEFQLLSSHELSTYVRWIADDAGLDIDDDAIAHVVRQGRGSARDTLSALDQVVAAGGVMVRTQPVDDLIEALANHQSGDAVAAVAAALSQGQDPRVLGDALLSVLRDAFLVSLGVDVPHLVDADRERIVDWAHRLGTPALTRAVEALGSALVDMRQAADPRVPLEVALVRLTTSAGGSTAELLDRIEKLERAVASGLAATAGGGTAGPAPTSGAGSDEVDAASGRSGETATVPDGVLAGGVVAAAAGAAHPEPGQADPTSSDGPARAREALREAQAKATHHDPSDTPAVTGRAASRGPAPKAPPRAPRRSASPRGSDPATSDTERSNTERSNTETSNTERSNSENTASAPPASTPDTAAPPAAASSDRSRPPEASDPGTGPATSAADASVDLGLPDRDALVIAFADSVVPTLKGMAKAIYTNGRFVAVTERGAVFALDNAPTRERAEKHRPTVESALAAHFGRPVPIVLIDEADARDHETDGPAPGPTPSSAPAPAAPATVSTPTPATSDVVGGSDHRAGPANASADSDPVGKVSVGKVPVDKVSVGKVSGDKAPADDDEPTIDVSELTDATDVAVSGLDKLTEAFPGAVLVEGEDAPR